MRHRSALIGMLFDYFETRRLAICIDPDSFELIGELLTDPQGVRLLEIQCEMSDAYLIGHARRVGLAREETGPEALAQLLPAVRNDVIFQSDRIRDSKFAGHLRFQEGGDPALNAQAIGQFLKVPDAVAQVIAETDYLFED